jgi:1-acyl-sn-glycerol-3-phosphate acyltransferase
MSTRETEQDAESGRAQTRTVEPPETDLPTAQSKALPLSARSSDTYRAVYPWARVLLRIVMRILAPRLRITGRHHVPRRGPVILTPNHISDSDPPFVLNGSPRPLWFMAKRELFEMGALGPAIRFCQAFPVDPGEADRAALRFTEELLRSGQAVVVFPEGRIAADGVLQDISAGVVLLALRSGVPIVPVGLWGTSHVVPYGTVIPRPTLARVRVHYGKPIHFDDFRTLPRRQQRDAAATRLEDALRAAREVAINS